MKSDLQKRAEYLSQRYLENPRKAVVIEFAGVPKAGKTTILTHIYSFLKRCGFHPEVVIERASLCPIRDKKHFNFNVWTACTTLSQILDKTQEPPIEGDPNVLILDRGLFDSICWLNVMEQTGRILPKDRELIEEFLLINDWKKRISAVILMKVSPKDSMERERGLLPVEEAEGSIMNAQMLQLMLQVTKDTSKRLNHHFRIFEIDTSSNLKRELKATAEEVSNHILDVIEEQIREDILCLPKNIVTNMFQNQVCIGKQQTLSLLEDFSKKGQFISRNEVELDDDFVQALPVVVLRNKTGDILQLRRREKTKDNPLNGKIVIWAGGHVRIEDKHNGNPIIQCIIRELKEEIRLNVMEKDLILLGAIYSDVGGKTSKHTTIVYEWRADSDYIDIALCSAEFFERRGTSLSGKFVGINKIKQIIKDKKESEPWSEEIFDHFLDGEERGQKRMFT